ncbi:SRPBCC family protein [Phytomonospora sp. NPDC050363]|uniref:SRPBCC family protein n=1 Tax=Phytomonospora sp. NPDC050363 TaxID=3155642 RepID=UPI0033FC1CE5
MHLTASAATTASPRRCWTVLTDVADWPNWTTSITSVTPFDGPELAVGRRYRLEQPGMPALVWTVKTLVEGEYFDWEARSPGVRTVGRHALHPTDTGTRIEVGIDQTGPLAWLAGLLMGAKTRRYLALEAAGLKAAGESR